MHIDVFGNWLVVDQMFLDFPLFLFIYYFGKCIFILIYILENYNTPMKFIIPIENYLNEDLYDFHEIPIHITPDNYKEALVLRKKFSLFNNIGIATFLTTTFLWRVVDEKEFNIIIKTKKISGGEYSVPPEKYMGASFGGSRGEVIKWGLKVKKNGRYSGKLYIIGINAEDKEFLNLNM